MRGSINRVGSGKFLDEDIRMRASFPKNNPKSPQQAKQKKPESEKKPLAFTSIKEVIAFHTRIVKKTGYSKSKETPYKPLANRCISA